MNRTSFAFVGALTLCAGSALAQTGGGGNPSFTQPATPTGPTSPGRQADGRIDLRPRFEKGQQIKFKLEVTNTATQPAVEVDPLDDPDHPKPAKKPARNDKPDKPELEKTKSKIEFGLVLTVREVDEARTSTVDMKFETIKVAIDGPGLKEEFDSTKVRPASKAGETDLMATALKPMVGSTFTMTIDRSGNISSVTGGDGFAMLGQVAPGGGSLPQVFGPIFTSKKGDGFARIGESWENADKLASGVMGDFKMTTRHTLQSASGNTAQVELRGRIEGATQAPGSTTFQIKESSYTGRYTWDAALGMLKQMETRMSVRVEQKLTDHPVDVTSETTTKLTRVN